MKTIRLFSKFPESQLPVVLSNEAFFITEVLEKIDNFTDRELEVMKEIDGITFIKGQYIETKFGSTHISKISTGLKTYLNLSILQRLNIPATVYITEAGPNVLKYIFEDIDTDFFNLVLTHGEIPDVEKYHFIVNGEEILNPDDMYGMGVDL